MKKLLTIMMMGLLLLAVQETQAQNSLLRYADKQYSLSNYQHAAEVYEQAFERREKYETARMIAMSYTNIRDYQKSNAWWKKTVGFEEANRDDY